MVKCNYKQCKDETCPHRNEHELTDECYPVYCIDSVPYKKVFCVEIDKKELDKTELIL
jgi:hypothetical protein